MKKSIEQIWELIDKYFDGFKTKFDPDIFADEYQNHGPMKNEIKGSRTKQQFLQEMEIFAKNAPLEQTQGASGITIIAKSYDLDKDLALVFYRMHFKNNLNLDVVDLFRIKNQKIVDITGVFDPRPFF